MINAQRAFEMLSRDWTWLSKEFVEITSVETLQSQISQNVRQSNVDLRPCTQMSTRDRPLDVNKATRDETFFPRAILLAEQIFDSTASPEVVLLSGTTRFCHQHFSLEKHLTWSSRHRVEFWKSWKLLKKIVYEGRQRTKHEVSLSMVDDDFFVVHCIKQN